MFFTSYKHFQCFVLLNIIASQTYAAVAPIKVDCWWTGCQLNTWKVVGCDQYNRTQQNIKYCDGGLEYYCCTSDRDKVTPPVDNCWWTGCQLNTWKVVGCNQYNRIQKNVKNCYGGSEYYCCTAGQENMKQPANECWWTGCQLNTWKVVGCDQYNRTQQNIKNCNGGSEYYCCTTGHENVNDKVNEIVTQPANDCWWTGCQLSTWPVVGCDQYNRIQKNVKNCNGGSEYYCCTAGQENLNMNVNVNNKVNENVMQPANDCWWTGCQPNTWLVVGCSQYNRTQQNIKNCDGGSEYYCCTTGQKNLNVNVNDIVTQPANDCWWTGCQPNTWLVVGCSQYNRTQKNVKDCYGGSEYYCCTTGQENLNVNVNDKVNENVMQPANDCWWTGCQPNTWLVVGCSQYNRTQKNVKDCYGGSEYYCCTTGQENLNVNVNEIVTQPANDCWWTGCQPNTWLVVGCSQYNRTQKNVKDCNGGSEYYCCTTGQENLNVNVNDKVNENLNVNVNENVMQPDDDCWWTECQLNSWEVRVCDSYNRTERERTACELGGLKYECCARREIDNIDVRGGFFEENCLWSRCQPKEMSGRGCPSNTVQMGLHPCPNGDLFHCCSESISVDVNG